MRENEEALKKEECPMNLQEMKERKIELGLSNEKISELSGVPLGTVQKIFAGITKMPRYDTISALEKVLENGGFERALCESVPQPSGSAGVREAAVRYGSANTAVKDPDQGGYTIEDYYALPDERRVELIDGIFYDMAAPVPVHQIILLQLHLQLAACAESHPECEVFVAPCDVRLDRDNRTMVQPDVFVICSDDQITKKRIEGAPDFVIEILSPSSRSHDMFRKLNKYRYAGVREYWIVDPDELKIIVYDLEHDSLPEKYTFRDSVPVLISGGECSVDFQRIYDKIKRYL